jgi:hypothetical protein
MTLEDLTKPNLVTIAGVAALSLALPALVPSLRPVVVSALKIGMALLREADGEAESELIQSLVSATMREIARELSGSAEPPEQRAAVRRRIGHFKRQAQARAQRWAADDHAANRCYRRHVTKLHAALNAEKRQVGPRRQQLIEDASADLLEGMAG